MNLLRGLLGKGVGFLLFSVFQDRCPVRSSKLFSVRSRNRLFFEDLQFSNHYQLGWDSDSSAGDYQTATKELGFSFITCVDWVQLLTRKEGHCLILAPFLWLQWCLSRNTFGLKTVALNWSSESLNPVSSRGLGILHYFLRFTCGIFPNATFLSLYWHTNGTCT